PQPCPFLPASPALRQESRAPGGNRTESDRATVRGSVEPGDPPPRRAAGTLRDQENVRRRRTMGVRMSEPLRIGIVGAGFIAGVIAAAIRDTPAARTTAVASRTRASADRLADAYAIPHVFDRWTDLIASGTCDAVYVATPTVAREEICLAAARGGLHVLGDKPFASADSVRRIGDACLAAGVAFLDATHFVHHPRHRMLKESFEARIGGARAIHTSFFFPNDDPANIRFRPEYEPTGAVGDMAWYSMRAVVEFTPDTARFESGKGYLVRHPATQGVVRTSGVLRLDNGTHSVWEAGYDTGSCVQDLAVQGDSGMIAQHDFVLDWAGGFGFPDPAHRVHFVQRNGPATPKDWKTVDTPSEPRQAVRLVESFAALAAAPDRSAVEASIRSTVRTQELVDAIWAVSVD
ncbi:MAG: Gfo/Idh/MocA family protein, partial [Armatimonadota bacterium]